MSKDKKELINRLSRIEGQVAALKRTIEKDEDQRCKDLIYQIKAARSALKKVGDMYVTNYMDECLEKKTSTKEKRQDIFDALKALFNS